MSTPRPPDNASRPDDLKQRYLQASEAQTAGPSDRVRRAALDHAQMVAASTAPAAHVALPQAKPAAAANRWNFTLVASVAIAGISALLALQFDRSDSEDKAVVLGTPSVTAPPVAAQPAPAQSPELNAGTSAADAANKSGAESAAQSAPELLAVPAARPTAKAQAPKPTAAPNVKEPPTEALARPAPAPAAPLMKSESESQSEKASAERPFQATPPTAQKRSAPLADAEFSAQPTARMQGAEPSAPSAEMKSRAAPVQGSALRNAASSGQMAALEQALQQATPAQINARDDRGRTPLMLATLGGHIGAVQRLLTAGADATLQDAQGNTAGQMAQQLGYTIIANLLKKQPVAQ